jgi:hypothetical protein
MERRRGQNVDDDDDADTTAAAAEVAEAAGPSVTTKRRRRWESPRGSVPLAEVRRTRRRSVGWRTAGDPAAVAGRQLARAASNSTALVVSD